MAVHFKVYDKHLPVCQTNIARLAILLNNQGGLPPPTPRAPMRKSQMGKLMFVICTQIYHNQRMNQAKQLKHEGLRVLISGGNHTLLKFKSGTEEKK